MAVYAIADTHLSTELDKPMDVFGSRWKGYTEKLETAWRETVAGGDTVVVPGDISWAMHIEEALPDLHFLDSLPGTKILGRGNHDFWWETVKKLNGIFLREGITSLRLLYNNAFYVDGLAICGTRGWFYDQNNAPKGTDYKKLIAREALRLGMSLDAANSVAPPDAERAVFLHFPPKFGDFVCRELIDVMKARGVRRCFCGHIHGVYDLPQTELFEGLELTLISADYLNFTPLRIS
ncbi:MAG: serine/threonine protein phosphatase [Clostridiales bacterium]|nr:serine/threonine protein phosphatase [Clostridiales bacterium]